MTKQKESRNQKSTQLTEVGFEPTLSLEKRRSKKILKSSALDHSAIPPFFREVETEILSEAVVGGGVVRA